MCFRRDAKGASEYKLRLFDLQTECYQVLERLLVLLGREAEALVVAERARTRAFVDHLHAHAHEGGRNGNNNRDAIQFCREISRR